MSSYRVVAIYDKGEETLPNLFEVSSSGITLTDLMARAKELALVRSAHSYRLEWYSPQRNMWHPSMTVFVRHKQPTETVLCGN